MAWKNVRDHYRIAHLVHVSAGTLWIGSPYCPRLIGIDPATGNVTQRYDKTDINADLTRYQREFDADPETLRRLVTTPDTFTASLPVYSYDEERGIIEDRCEAHGWPHVTHTGALQYENKWFPRREDAVRAAIRNAECWIENSVRRIQELTAQLERAKLDHASAVVSHQRFSQEPH